MTTSTVTVPWWRPWGWGLRATSRAQSAPRRLRLIAFASLFPIMTVMGYAQLSEWSTGAASRVRIIRRLNPCTSSSSRVCRRQRNPGRARGRAQGRRHRLHRHQPGPGRGVEKSKTFFGLTLETQRDVVLLVVEEHMSRTILETIAKAANFDEKPGTASPSRWTWRMPWASATSQRSSPRP